MKRQKELNMTAVKYFSQFCFFCPSFSVGVVWMKEGEGQCFLTGDI